MSCTKVICSNRKIEKHLLDYSGNAHLCRADWKFARLATPNNLREECVLKSPYSFVVSFARAFNCIPIRLSTLPRPNECLEGRTDEHRGAPSVSNYLAQTHFIL